MSNITRYCSCCGTELTNSYIQVKDNYLVVKYFESHKENRFCSTDCIASYLCAETVFIGDDDDYLDDEEE